MKNIKKAVLFSLICFIVMGFSGCAVIVNDLLPGSNTASWTDSDCDEILVGFNDDTKETKDINLMFYTSSKYGSCYETSRSSTSKTMIIKLNRKVKSGESVDITWRKTWDSTTLYGKN